MLGLLLRIFHPSWNYKSHHETHGKKNCFIFLQNILRYIYKDTNLPLEHYQPSKDKVSEAKLYEMFIQKKRAACST